MMDRNQLVQTDFFKNSTINSDFLILMMLGLFIVMVILSYVYYSVNNMDVEKRSFITYITFAFIGLLVLIPSLLQRNPIVGFGLFLLTFLILHLLYKYWQHTVPIQSSAGIPENLSRERDKIFQLLENGKINVQEAKGLLNVLYKPVEKSEMDSQMKSSNKAGGMNENPVAG